MYIASLVARRLVLSAATKSRREVARQNQTSAYCSTGRIQWRVHNTRARTTKSAPDASNVRNTGPAYATNRILSLPPPPPPLSFSVSLSRSFHYLFSKTHRHHPHSQPLGPLSATKRLRNSIGRSCVSPIEMYRFHYKLLMRQICLSACRCLYRPPLSRCGHCLSTADNNI